MVAPAAVAPIAAALSVGKKVSDDSDDDDDDALAEVHPHGMRGSMKWGSGSAIICYFIGWLDGCVGRGGGSGTGSPTLFDSPLNTTGLLPRARGPVVGEPPAPHYEIKFNLISTGSASSFLKFVGTSG